MFPLNVTAAAAQEKIVATNESITTVVLFPAGAQAGYRAGSDGNVYAVRISGVTDIGDWLEPLGAAPGTYEIRAAYVGDALFGASSPLNTWLALTSNREWSIVEVSTGTKSGTLTIDYRKGSGPILATITATLSATATV